MAYAELDFGVLVGSQPTLMARDFFKMCRNKYHICIKKPSISRQVSIVGSLQVHVWMGQLC